MFSGEDQDGQSTYCVPWFLDVARVVGGGGFERRSQTFDDGGKIFGHLSAQILLTTNVAFRTPTGSDECSLQAFTPKHPTPTSATRCTVGGISC